MQNASSTPYVQKTTDSKGKSRLTKRQRRMVQKAMNKSAAKNLAERLDATQKKLRKAEEHRELYRAQMKAYEAVLEDITKSAWLYLRTRGKIRTMINQFKGENYGITEQS